MPKRRALCVFARFTPCFATFHTAQAFFPGTVAFMPPQGMLTLAAYLPKDWEIRFVDENVAPVTDDDLEWCDVLLASGMHVQRGRLNELARLAQERGKPAVVGGPSVSACPEYYPDVDMLHVGELGDATDQLIAHLSASAARPETQLVFRTEERLPINDFPIPAYHLAQLKAYLVLNVQWSSGCPYRCEFCDIPELYGNKARTKSPERLIAELDAIADQVQMGGIYFVDDNLIGSKKAAKELMHHLIAWQKRTGYRLRLAGEATINLAKDTELLGLMRDAYFTDMFFGIETPNLEALRHINKRHNMTMPILDAVKVINDHGIELHGGIIFGFDTDTEDTADQVIDFIRAANIPLLAINVLYALPRTPLHRRLTEEGRLLPTEEVRESNVRFLRPEEEVVESWRRAVDVLYHPKELFRRYEHNVEHTYPNRLQLPMSRFGISTDLVWTGIYATTRMVVIQGLMAEHRREFWSIAWKLLRQGKLDHLLHLGAMGHHLTSYREDVLDARVRASNFNHDGMDEGDARPGLWQRLFGRKAA
ncbi:MAG: B12-binding domain-containing radical SAM protein [Alphaproteobacteria bacterium]|nr:B12-binding domain-containing radical SAM protein [Alphaproteobacteria bacterium]